MCECGRTFGHDANCPALHWEPGKASLSISSCLVAERVESDRQMINAEIQGPFISPGDGEERIICGVVDDAPQVYLDLIAIELTTLRLKMDARAVASLIRRLADAQEALLRREGR